MIYLYAFIAISISFLTIGIGILFFKRTSLGGECGTIPGKKTDPCLSQKAGLCPMEDKDGYIKLATMASRLNNKEKL